MASPKILQPYNIAYGTGPAKIDHLSAKIIDFVHFPTIKSSSLMQNLMGFLLQLTELGYYVLNERY